VIAKYSVIVLQSRHINGDHKEAWSDTLYYNVQYGWEREPGKSTRFMRSRQRGAFVKGYAAGCTAKEAVKLLNLASNNGTGERVITRDYRIVQESRP
jgi:hypothetical protein